MPTPVLPRAVIEDLIRRPKQMPAGWIDTLLAGAVAKGQHLKNEVVVTKLVHGPIFGHLEVFTRQSIAYPDNFSVGLRYVDDHGRTYNLLRCNGFHPGPHTTHWPERPGNRPRHLIPGNYAHIHHLTTLYQRRGQPDGFALPTTLYADIRGAAHVLGRKVHIESQYALQPTS
jgi:hypothetical protein